MEEQVPENPPTVLYSILFSGALSTFGLAVALTELGSEWTTASSVVGIATAIVFSAVVVISLRMFKATKLRIVAVLVTVITLLPLAAWSQKPFRRQVFNSFAGILPVVALKNAVKNDFLEVEGICKKISGLKNGDEKLMSISGSTPEILRICSSEIAKTPAGKLTLLAKIENDDAFCDFIGRLEHLDSIFMRLLVRGSMSVNSQKCLSAEIDKNYATDELLIKMLDNQKTPDLVNIVAEARYSKTSERLSSDALGVWLFQEGCMSQDPEILSYVGITDTCSTMTVESGWTDICERVGTEITMRKICILTRKFTLGTSINESKRIVHRAIRKYRIQIEAEGIGGYEDANPTGLSSLGGLGGSGAAAQLRKLQRSGLSGLANGIVSVGGRNAALMPMEMSGLIGDIQGTKMPSFSPEEWEEMRENALNQMINGGEYEDSRIGPYLASKGLSDFLPGGGKSLKELFEAQGETLSPEEAKRLEGAFAKFKKIQSKSGGKELTKNRSKKRVKKKRERAIKARPTLGN